jgi:uroporphyrinogen-III synthase
MNGALQGKCIVNTRAVHQAESLNVLLRAKGAVPLDYPCIAIVPPADSTALDQALIELNTGHFDWLVLTSANTVFAIAQRLRELGIALDDAKFRTAAVGAATASATHEQLGLTQIELPAQYIAEALAEHLPIASRSRVLLPESSIARTTLADRLAARGAAVMAVEAYQTVCGDGGVDVTHLLAQQQIDALTFTSSSTVTCFLERLTQVGGRQEDVLAICAACIGTKTAATAREYGFRNITAPSEHTLDGLLTALDAYLSQLPTGIQR